MFEGSAKVAATCVAVCAAKISISTVLAEASSLLRAQQCGKAFLLHACNLADRQAQKNGSNSQQHMCMLTQQDKCNKTNATARPVSSAWAVAMSSGFAFRQDSRLQHKTDGFFQ